MSIRKIKIYTKLTLIFLVLILVLLFIVSNRKKVSVDFLFWRSPLIPMFWFVISVATMGAIIYRITAGIRKVLKDYREVRKEEKTQRQLMEKMKNSVNANKSV